MTPAARWQAVIELLSDVENGGTADGAASSYFRARRFIGSKDRAFIADRLYALLRARARLDWWINRILERFAGAPPPPARHRVIAHLVLVEEWRSDAFEAFDGVMYRPDPPSRAERRLIEGLAGGRLDDPEQPHWVRAEMPGWSLAMLLETLDGDPRALAALNLPAPLDLRINPLAGVDRETVRQRLHDAGIEAVATALSPLGLRVEGRPALGRLDAFQEGLIEVQDEGSQLVALLVDPRPGEMVLDYCAGAGGKTLALAARMENKGRLVASDVSAQRLERAVKRLRRAGAHNVERRAITSENAGWFKRQRGRFDRVLVDAPCSGTGTWRRNPDMKWRITPEDVDNLAGEQHRILERASAFVKPGGRLVYATCSLLRVENEAVAEAFLAQQPGFELVPLGEIWPHAVGTALPHDGPFLRLSPLMHGTDGFFAAAFRRVNE